jgi:hypothetical protein
VKSAFKLSCSEENAERFLTWIKTRGGVASWPSVNLSNPAASWSTPVNNAQGKPTAKPTWEADSKPSVVVTDPAEVGVFRAKEVARFHVAVRLGSQGFAVKLTDGATRRVRAAVSKAGDGAYHEFDYAAQEAIIFASDGERSLVEWAAERGLS